MIYRVFLFVLLLLALCAGPSHAQERVALVIGNGAYAHANALPNPANDAEDVSAALRDLNFHVISATNVDRTGFEQKLRDFSKLLRGARTALFYYAGHGLQVAGKNYAVPIDAKLEVPSDLTFEAIDLDLILSLMQADGDRANLVFLDACRDNPLARSFARTLPATRSNSVASGLSSVDAGRGTMIAFATAPNKVALDGRGRNSPFTSALLRHIQTPRLDIARVMRRVTADVEAASNGTQVPWVHASLTKDVVLKSGGDGARPAPYTPSVVASADPGAQVPAAPAKVDFPNEPMPRDVSVDPEVLKIVETHPFFANAPVIKVVNYGITDNTDTSSNGASTSFLTETDLTVHPLRRGIYRSVWKAESRGTSRAKTFSSNHRSITEGQTVSAANGLIILADSTFYKSIPANANAPATTSGKIVRLSRLNGQIFPMRVGNEFSYSASHVSTTEQSGKSHRTEQAEDKSCQVTKQYDARRFHATLTGVAYLVACESRSVFTVNKTASNSNDETKTLFFEDLGYWLNIDPSSPREQLVVNRNYTSGGYTTRMTGSRILKSILLR